MNTMSATSTTASLSLSISGPRFRDSAKTHHFSPLPSSVSTRTMLVLHKQAPRVLLRHRKSIQLWRISASPEEIPQEIVSSSASESYSSSSSSSAAAAAVSGGEDGVSVVIQVLLFVAFAALSILTIGVIYIGVSEFLEKRERDKFEKEEAAAKKSKKGGKKKATRAKAGPRGFGQKFEDDEDDISLP